MLPSAAGVTRAAVEQPRVLDGDNGLGGEVLHQRYLLVREWPDFLPVNGNSTDYRVLAQHWHRQSGPCAGFFHQRRARIWFLAAEIANMIHLFGFYARPNNCS